MQSGRIRSNASGWQSIGFSGDIETVPGATDRVYSRDLCFLVTQSTGLRSTADLWHPATFAVVGVLWEIHELCHPPEMALSYRRNQKMGCLLFNEQVRAVAFFGPVEVRGFEFANRPRTICAVSVAVLRILDSITHSSY